MCQLEKWFKYLNVYFRKDSIWRYMLVVFSCQRSIYLEGGVDSFKDRVKIVGES